MKQWLIALDQLLNCTIGWLLPGGTWADETLSSRAHRQWPRFEKILDFIFGARHCAESYFSERDRLQCPPELRK